MRALRALMAIVMAMPIVATPADLSHALGGQLEVNNEVGGRAAVDVLPGARTGLGYTLRHGGIIRGSVRVEVSGRPLKDNEFTVDHSSGVLYVAAQVRDSDSIRVSYRHDPNRKDDGGLGALPLIKLQFNQSSSVTMLMGVNGVNRMANGTVTQSHSLGMKNNFSFSGAEISGLFMLSSQEKAMVRADGASPGSSQSHNATEGTDALVMQNLKTDIGGGVSLTAEYRDVGEKFTGFGMLESAGVEKKIAEQLEKEKGISRFGLGLTGGEGAFKFNNSLRVIDDGKGTIEFHKYAVDTGLLNVYYNAQRVDSNFSRFKDIAESERAQLQKERGIDRFNMGGLLNFGAGSLKFDRNAIEQNDAGIYRDVFALETPWLKASFNTQRVDQGFTRSNDLSEKDRAQWAKERGLERENWNIAIPKSADAQWLSFSQMLVSENDRGFRSTALSANAMGFGVELWQRSTDASFLRICDLTQEERDGMIQQTLAMYGSGKPSNNDRQWISRESGLDRSFLRIAGEPWKGGALSFENIGITDGGSGLSRQAVNFKSGDLNLAYRRTSIDHDFGRLFDLLETERKLYGNQMGFDRMDLAADWKIAGHTLGFTHLGVGSKEGGAERITAALKGPGYEFEGATRRVDGGFSRAGDINDPDRNFFNELVGFNQYDMKFKLNAIKNLKINAFLYDSNNGDDMLRRYKRQAEIVYTPDKHTSLRLHMNDHRFGGSLEGSLFSNDLLALQGSRDFGQLGKLTILREEERLGGKDNGGPDRETNVLRYETGFMKNLKLVTEQARTSFADGGFENSQAYRVNWDITKRLGVNFTQILTERDGKKPDESTSNFGFSYDFGNNLKLGYTFANDSKTGVANKGNSGWTLTPGELGGVNFGGSYQEKWRDNRTSALGNFTLSTPKPFDFAFFRDVKVQIGYDSATDNGIWQKETQLADFAATVFGSKIGATYSHLMLPSQVRAADRTFKFNLDPTGKDPLQLDLLYKIRTMPNGENTVIRDYNIGYKLNETISVEHKANTFPEKNAQGAPFGTSTQPTTARTYAVNYIPNDFASFRFGFDEAVNLQQETLARRANVTVSMFNDTGSPLKLTYGVEQNERQGDRKTRHQYELAFDQKPGPNQTLSLIMGSVNWEHGIVDGQYWNSIILRADYQLRF